MSPTSRFDHAAEAARNRALVVGIVVALVLGVAVAVVAWGLGVGVAVLGSAGWAAFVLTAFTRAADRALERTGGRPVPMSEAPSLANALDGTALLTGVSAPALALVDSPTANAAVVAGPGRATVVATRGLLDGARPIELEVMAAELLCRVRDGSASYASLAAGLPGWLARLAGLAPSAIAGVLGEQRALQADLDAISVTRYPPGLVVALERMERLGTAVERADLSTAPLWVAPVAPAGRGMDPALDDSVNQPLGLRIAMLREL